MALGAAASLLAVATASAQEAAGEVAGDGEVGSGVTSFGLGDWVSLGLRLGLVILVIWGAVHAMRWYVRRMNRGGSRGGIRALEVLETHALGPNRTLHLVRLGDRAVLVGATQERITQLLTVEDPEEFKRLMDTPDEDGEISQAPRAMSAAFGAMSLLGSLRTGIVAMRSRQAEMNARIKAQRAAASESSDEADEDTSGSQSRRRARTGRPAARRTTGAAVAVDHSEVEGDASTPAAPRFGALKGILARADRNDRGGRDASTDDEIINAEAPEPRQSLFDRALASIDSIEVVPPSTAAGPRARASYGAARADMASSTPPSSTPPSSGRSREAQIADLQRAIAAARRNAG